jgi:hypothetical protein
MRYSSIVATLALFIALGGTAAAVTTLPRDSVGAPQIRKDAVRSPEIAKDAVRSPEIAAGAVRSSELRDGGIKLIDISAHAQKALAGAQGPAGVAEARVAQAIDQSIPSCESPLSDCRNIVTRTLGKGNWIVEAKLDVANAGALSHFNDDCGLLQGSSVLDSASFHLDGATGNIDVEDMALSAVVENATNRTTVALRCTEHSGEDLHVQDTRITALQVTNVVGP